MKKLALLVPLLLGSCQNFAIEGETGGRLPDAAEAENRKFESLAEAYIACYYAQHPATATNDGIHDYDHTLGRFSSEDVASATRNLRRYQERLWRIDRSLLTDANAADALIVEAHVKAGLLDLEQIRTWERNPNFYNDAISSGIYSILSRRFASPEVRMDLAARRLGDVPGVLQDAKANLARPARLHTDMAIREFTGLHEFIKGLDFLADQPGHDEALLKRFEAARQPALKSIENFVDWMRKDLLARSDGEFAIGEKNFVAKLACEEMVETPIETLLADGYALLRTTQEEFKRVASEIDPQKSPGRVLKDLAKDHPAAENLLEETRRMLDGIRKFCVDRLIDIPSDAACEVQETPAFRRSTSFASMEIPGPFEAIAKEAYYCVTLPEPGWGEKEREDHLSFFNRYSLPLISIHEAYPGHYTQFLQLKKCSGKARKVFGCGSFSEGWAHYCEQLLVDEGFFGADTPKARLAQLSMALLRICRYIAGIQLHCRGWTYEQAVAFFTTEGYLEPINARREALRGTNDPTYLVYTLGKMQILKLRDEYRAKKGGSLRDFHNALLSYGYPPVSVVRSLLLGLRPR